MNTHPLVRNNPAFFSTEPFLQAGLGLMAVESFDWVITNFKEANWGSSEIHEVYQVLNDFITGVDQIQTTTGISFTQESLSPAQRVTIENKFNELNTNFTEAMAPYSRSTYRKILIRAVIIAAYILVGAAIMAGAAYFVACDSVAHSLMYAAASEEIKAAAVISFTKLGACMGGIFGGGLGFFDTIRPNASRLASSVSSCSREVIQMVLNNKPSQI